jgi:CRP-like cAMP-binding protein
MGNKTGKIAGKEAPKLKAPETAQAANNKNESTGAKLKFCPLLSSYTDEERARIGSSTQIRKFKAGECVVNQGDEGDGFYIIESGDCQVVVKDANGETEIGRLKDGDYFGEMALQNNQPRGATVRALTDASTFFMHRDEFHRIFTDSNVKFAKRVAISAETQKGREGDYKLPANAVTTKDINTTILILEAVKTNVLFSGLDRETRTKVVVEMYRLDIKTGEVPIQQGEKGDLFYVVQTGSFDIEVDGDKVTSRGPGTCFGELALMYNAPRAATVRASSDSVTWVIHRTTYRRVVKDVSAVRLLEHIAFLKTVSLLAPLTSYEREKLAESLEEVVFPPNAKIFQQGSEGITMYIVQSGEGVGEKDDVEVARCKKGDYFGERALLKNERRAATVKVGPEHEMVCLSVDREAFQLLLGPLENILAQKAASYEDIKEPPTPSSAGSPPPLQKHIPVPFGDLKILGTLGKGSFGHVQLVQDKTSGATYALKAVSKARIVETGQQGHIMSEKNVMVQLNHPFLIRLFQTYKDRDKLYFLLEPMLGGELFTLLRNQTLFDENTSRFYASCVVSAFEYMHDLDIIYRDLKPENLLFDDMGYVKIADFGFAKKVTGRTWTLCGTPDYLAPEIVAGKGHDKGVDWWTLGILIYEMLASYPPFYDEEHMKTYAKIINGEVLYPSHFSKAAISLIRKLLNRKATKRIGIGRGGARLVRKHVWFEPIDFDRLYRKQIEAPMIPTIKSNTYLGNYLDVEGEEEDPVAPYHEDNEEKHWDDDF